MSMDERLSEREFHVVSLVAEGMTNRQIGDRLHMAENTVNRTLMRMFRRLGVRDRAHAVAWAFRNGYLRVPKTSRRRALRPPRTLRPHGTRAAAERHRYHGEKLCDVCREGRRHADRVSKREARKKVAA